MHKYFTRPVLTFLPICILLMAAAPFAAHGQSQRDSVRTFYFDPVVVTGTNTDVLRSSLPNSISVIGRDEIRQSGETSLLSIINKRVPGVFVTERGVLGYGSSDAGAGSISIRGAGGRPNTEVLVMTDGRPQMMGLFGHPLPDTYVSSDVERVEVIRGPASLVHGTNAMGGVINIITDKYRMQGARYHAGASLGTYGTEKLEAGMSYGLPGASVSVSGNHYQTDGHRANSSFRMNNGSIGANTALGEHFFLSADASVSAYKALDPGMITAPAVNHWVDITRGSSGFAVENRSETVQGAFKFFYNFGIHDIYDGFHSTDKNVGVMLYESVKLQRSTEITAGIDYKQYGGSAENKTFHSDFGTHTINEMGAYMLLQQLLFDILTVNGGVRLNDNSRYGTEVVPQLGLAVRIDSSTTLKATAGKGFRSPTIRELYLFPAPTPTLEPERMWNYEAGVLYHYEDLASGELTAFVAEGSNIIRVGGMFPRLTLGNSGAFVHRGVEFSATVRARRDLSFDATYSYLDPGNETMANPRHKLYLGGVYSWSTIVVNAGFQHVEKLYGADNGAGLLPDYTIANARVSWNITPSLGLFVSGENLFDSGYTIMAGYPMPGRTFIAGISLR